MGRKRRRQARRGSGRRWLWTALFLLLVAAGLYVGYLDLVVRHKFEGTRWALPARVYARPLELYVGAPVSRAVLLEELARLGYQRLLHADEPGSFAVSASRVELHSRGFRFSDGEESPARVLIGLDGDLVSSMVHTRTGEPAHLVRLEPEVVGSFYPASNEDRLLVQLSEVPELLVRALIAVEDRNFFQHHGISLRGIARAMVADLKAGRIVQGGSTLTQQLVKNFYLSSQRSLIRKGNEIIMALLLEWHYDKEEILEAYLNEVFLGQAGRRSVHGFAQGAQLFFGRPLAELSPGQLALLAGMVKAPSLYNPRRHPEQALQRRNLVIGVLRELAIISEREAQRAKAEPLGVKRSVSVGLYRYPDFLDLVRRQLRRDYPDHVVRSAGLRIFSTLNPQYQSVLEKVLSERAEFLAERTGGGEQLQAAMVISDVANSEVLALVGSRNPRTGGFNRALDLRRSVGSLIKPGVYLAALLRPNRWHLGSYLLDMPLEVPLPGQEPWRPQNYDGRFRGEVSLLEALFHSLNVPTVRLGLELGLPEVLETLKKMGLRRPVEQNPSLLLGVLGVSPLEVNQLYLTLAAGGFFTPQRAILSVTDHAGVTLSRYALQVEQTLDPSAVKLLQLALQEVARRGTATALNQYLDPNLNLAVKTGTTDDYRDSWFAGFSANISAVTWVGRDDNVPTGLSGASGALPIWGAVMQRLSLVPNDRGTDERILWQPVSSTGAGVPVPAGISCPGGYGLPRVAESVPPGTRLCSERDASDSDAEPSPSNPLQWLLDKFN